MLDLYDKITEAISGDGYDSQSIVTKALEGDKRALLIVTDIVGRLAGIPGTAQATKYIRAKDRGESEIGAIFGAYTPRSGGGSSRTRTKRKRRKRSR